MRGASSAARAARRVVDDLVERRAEPDVEERADRGEHDRHREREREREPQPDRQPRHGVPPSAAAGSPRRAPSRASCGRTAGRSSRAGSGRRRRRRSSGSRTRSPTRARAAGSGRAPRPGRRMNVSSSANSFADSAISARSAPDLPRRRVEPQVADLEHRRPLDVALAATSARSRASSSANENGFVR